MTDVSGDGPNNDGNRMTEVHDRVIAQGIAVNGLPAWTTMPMAIFPTSTNIMLLVWPVDGVLSGGCS